MPPVPLKYASASTVYVQIFEGHKFHKIRRKQYFREILVLNIRILPLINIKTWPKNCEKGQKLGFVNFCPSKICTYMVSYPLTF